MKGFTLVWAKILDSSIWMEDKETRLVWITLLAMKDKDGIIQASKKNLAHRARVEPEECERALEILLNPDEETCTQEYEGRRIKEIEGGWLILNHDKYRFSNEAQRAFWAEDKAKQRQRSKALEGVGAGNSGPTPRRRRRKLGTEPGFVSHERSLQAGATQKQTDAIVEDSIKVNATNGSSVLAPTTIVEVPAVPEKKMPEYDDGSGSEIMPPEGAGS